MKVKSTLISAASGSLGGLTFQRGRGGMIIKSYSKPCNKQSAFQSFQRTIFSRLLTFWSMLSAPEQAGWQNYADSVSITNTTGFHARLVGRDHFIRSNMPRQMYYTPLPIITKAPTILSLGGSPKLENISGYIDGNGDFAIVYDVSFADPPAPNNYDNFLLFKGTSSCELSVLRCRKPFKYFVTLGLDDIAVWPFHYESRLTWPPWIGPQDRGPYDFSREFTKIFTSASISRSDGRLSPSFEFSVISPQHS